MDSLAMLQQMNSKRGFAKVSARARAMNSNEPTPKKAPACKRKKGGKCRVEVARDTRLTFRDEAPTQEWV